MNDRNLTPAQAAGVLDVSASTLRRWSTDFGDHLSASARGGGKRKRSYTPDDLAVLSRARDLLRAGTSPIEVAAQLAIVDEHAGTDLIALPAIAGELVAAREAVNRLATEVARLSAADEAKQRTIDELTRRLDALEGRPFWRRLFGR
jgi:DNA-binding transcriptional MerR regulator